MPGAAGARSAYHPRPDATLPAVPAPPSPRGDALRRASLRCVRPRAALQAGPWRRRRLGRLGAALPPVPGRLRPAQAWPYQSRGSVSSGAVTLGNVALEFMATEVAGTDAGFTGIAFEPVGDAADAIAELDRRQVARGEEDSRVGWSSVPLPGIPPAGAAFVWDDKPRARVAEGQRAASDALLKRDGGPLGVSSLREIVVSSRSPKEAASAWAKLADFEAQDGLLAFGLGPGIRVTKEDGPDREDRPRHPVRAGRGRVPEIAEDAGEGRVLPHHRTGRRRRSRHRPRGGIANRSAG